MHGLVTLAENDSPNEDQGGLFSLSATRAVLDDRHGGLFSLFATRTDHQVCECNDALTSLGCIDGVCLQPDQS